MAHQEDQRVLAQRARYRRPPPRHQEVQQAGRGHRRQHHPSASASQWKPGQNVGLGRNHAIFALVNGNVESPARKAEGRVHVFVRPGPAPAAAASNCPPPPRRISSGVDRHAGPRPLQGPATAAPDLQPAPREATPGSRSPPTGAASPAASPPSPPSTPDAGP